MSSWITAAHSSRAKSTAKRCLCFTLAHVVVEAFSMAHSHWPWEQTRDECCPSAQIVSSRAAFASLPGGHWPSVALFASRVCAFSVGTSTDAVHRLYTVHRVVSYSMSISRIGGRLRANAAEDLAGVLEGDKRGVGVAFLIDDLLMRSLLASFDSSAGITAKLISHLQVRTLCTSVLRRQCRDGTIT